MYTQVSIDWHIYTHTHLHVYICTFIHTCIYIHIYIYAGYWLEYNAMQLSIILDFFWYVFGVKQIINSLPFLFLFTHIGLNLIFKKCSNNRANHENLDLSRFYKNWTNQTKKKYFKNDSIFCFRTLYINKLYSIIRPIHIFNIRLLWIELKYIYVCISCRYR